MGGKRKRPLVAHLTCAHVAHDTRILHKECKSLAQAGHEVVLIAPAEGDHELHGVRILAIRPETIRWRRFLLAPWRVFRRALRTGARVCHFHDPELIPIGLLLRVMGKVVVYDIHEDYPRVLLARGWVPRILRKPLAAMWALLEGASARAFSARVAATESIAARFGAGRLVVVRNLPDVTEFADGRQGAVATPGGDRVFLYAGAISRARGIVGLLKAMEQTENARLWLAGKFSEPGLREECERMPGWRKTDYLGWLERADVIAAMHDAFAGLVLPLPVPAYLDAWPVKLFEYMAAGLPVIASNLPVLRHIVSEARCGLLVDPRDPMQIAQAMEWMVRHPMEARAMGQRGQALVQEKYDWRQEEKKLLALYEELLSGANGP